MLVGEMQLAAGLRLLVNQSDLLGAHMTLFRVAMTLVFLAFARTQPSIAQSTFHQHLNPASTMNVSAVKVADAMLLSDGTSWTLGSIVGDDGVSEDGVLTRRTTAGTVVSHWRIVGPVRRPVQMLRLTDGDLIILSAVASIENPFGPAFAEVLRLTPEGALIWGYRYRSGASTTPMRALVMEADGVLIVVGTADAGTGNGDVWVVRASLATGSYLQMHTFGSNNPEEGYEVVPDANADLVVAGRTPLTPTGGGPAMPRPVLLRLTADTIDLLGVEAYNHQAYQLFDQPLRLYPRSDGGYTLVTRGTAFGPNLLAFFKLDSAFAPAGGRFYSLLTIGDVEALDDRIVTYGEARTEAFETGTVLHLFDADSLHTVAARHYPTESSVFPSTAIATSVGGLLLAVGAVHEDQSSITPYLSLNRTGKGGIGAMCDETTYLPFVGTDFDFDEEVADPGIVQTMLPVTADDVMSAITIETMNYTLLQACSITDLIFADDFESKSGKAMEQHCEEL